MFSYKRKSSKLFAQGRMRMSRESLECLDYEEIIDRTVTCEYVWAGVEDRLVHLGLMRMHYSIAEAGRVFTEVSK